MVALAVAYRPLGDYMYRMYRVGSSARHLRAERVMYRVIGVNPDGQQSWVVYARSVLAFSAVSILFLYAFLRLQNHL
ncbi:MAG TPA: potassium-transporting ATPase subunit KdpA [Actinophytocola sp.]|uniref:potassium-transporting ATPase subunit KdpA n=1 Tax=Actinophytocola sp. TaxID=1872138 RepID=UPI002DFA0617|nr:potassium-transporting ATPase subunit KdpA [Actinophytocola sp.]